MNTSVTNPIRLKAQPNGVVSANPHRVLMYLFFPGGGIGRYTHEWMSRLNAESHVQAELVCLPSYHWKSAADYPVWPYLREIGHKNSLRRRCRFLTGQLINPFRLVKRARSWQPNVIHLANVNHLTFPIWKRPLRSTGAVIACTVHDVRRACPILNRNYEEAQLRAFYRWADLLFVHSRAQAEDLVAFAQVPEEKITVVPHGPYHDGGASGTRNDLRREYGIPFDRRVALFFGIVRDEKNLDLLLRALAATRNRPHLLVAGRSASRNRGIEYYQALVKTLDLQDHVTFINEYIPDGRVADLFELSDWVALPYSRRFTSQSGVLNVAAAYRRPVLVSATATFRETLSSFDIGLLVEPDDQALLEEGIERMHIMLDTDHPFTFDSYLEAHSWQTNARLTVAAYERALASQSQGVAVGV